MQTIFIYGLYDPDEDYSHATRYIGQTANVHKRLLGHRGCGPTSGILAAWRDMVRACGRKIQARVLHEIQISDRNLERSMILKTESDFIQEELKNNPYLLNQPYWTRDKVKSGIPKLIVDIYASLAAEYAKVKRGIREWSPPLNYVRKIEAKYPRLDIFPCFYA